MIFNSFSIPFGIAFEPKFMENPAYQICMAIIDMSFIMDIMIVFRTTVQDNNGKEVTNSKIIAI